LIRSSSARIFRQDLPLSRSAIRISKSASQQIRTWARIRSSSRWKTGRIRSVPLRSRKQRSASTRFL
jgi:hypothetical protein